MFWKKYHEILFKYLDLNEIYNSNHIHGEMKLESLVYQGKYITKSRVTNITNLNGISSIYNNIIYPKTGKNLPCFGMDLMAFFEKKVILTFDFQHPKENYDFRHEIVDKLIGDYLDNTKNIRFFELGNHFSRYVFVRKCCMDEIDQFLPVFEKYISTYSILLENANPKEINVSEFIDFDNYMLKLDPVSGYMKSNFGEEFSDKYVKEFLFAYSSLS